jgi:MFS family permease
MTGVISKTIGHAAGHCTAPYNRGPMTRPSIQAASSPAARRSPAASAVRAATGNFLEMYDFSVFAYYATAIGLTFFPGRSPFASLMSSLATFGVGFLMRPFGALALGAYVERHGRRAGLLLTLGLMAIGTLSIAAMPGFAVIGIAAPLLVVAGRLLQGFSAGVEPGGVSVYLSEIAPPERRGLYAAWQPASQQLAVILVALLGVVLGRTLSADEIDAWGWRIPFVIGCLIVPVVFVLRRSLQETDDFLARSRRPPAVAVVRSLFISWRLVLTGMLLVAMPTVWFQGITAYTPTFGRQTLALTTEDVFIVTLCVGVSNFLLLPLAGGISDVVGRRPLMIAFATIGMITAYPGMSWLASGPSFARLLTIELWLSLVYSGYNGAMIAYLAEVMPRSVRVAGFALAYSLATAAFGGFTPAISQYLIYLTGNRAMPAVWFSIACAIALIGLRAARAMPRQPPEV